MAWQFDKVYAYMPNYGKNGNGFQRWIFEAFFPVNGKLDKKWQWEATAKIF